MTDLGDHSTSPAVARAAYWRARERRLEHVRLISDGAPLEESDLLELRAREQAERQARRAWLALAPAAPTPQWPGGWRIRKRSGAIHRHGGVDDLGVWPSKQQAEHYRTGRSSWRDAVVEWCAFRNDVPDDMIEMDPVVLDDEFWREHRERPAVGLEPVEVQGDHDGKMI